MRVRVRVRVRVRACVRACVCVCVCVCEDYARFEAVFSVHRHARVDPIIIAYSAATVSAAAHDQSPIGLWLKRHLCPNPETTEGRLAP